MAATPPTLEATATEEDGTTTTVSIEVEIIRGPILVAEGAVADGSYSVLISPLVGYNFNGKTITFKVGGVDAPQSVSWSQGGGDIVDLSISSLN